MMGQNGGADKKKPTSTGGSEGSELSRDVEGTGRSRDLKGSKSSKGDRFFSNIIPSFIKRDGV